MIQEKKKPTPVKDILRGVKRKKPAKQILEAIQQSKNAGWDSSDRFVLDGQAIPSSNINELLTSAVKKRNTQLPGWKQFESITWQHL